MKTKILQFFHNPRIGIILLIMSIGMIGIIGIQLFWMHNAALMEEELFRKGVNRALNGVIHSLETRESAIMVGQTLALSDSVEDDVVITESQPVAPIPFPSSASETSAISPLIVQLPPQSAQKPTLPTQIVQQKIIQPVKSKKVFRPDSLHPQYVVLNGKDTRTSRPVFQNTTINISAQGSVAANRDMASREKPRRQGDKSPEISQSNAHSREQAVAVQHHPKQINKERRSTMQGTVVAVPSSEFFTMNDVLSKIQPFPEILANFYELSPQEQATSLGIVVDPKVLEDASAWVNYYKRYNDKGFRDSLRVALKKKIEAQVLHKGGGSETFSYSHSAKTGGGQSLQQGGVQPLSAVRGVQPLSAVNNSTRALSQTQRNLNDLQAKIQLSAQKLNVQQRVRGNQMMIQFGDGQQITIAVDSAVWGATGWSTPQTPQSPAVRTAHISTKAASINAEDCECEQEDQSVEDHPAPKAKSEKSKVIMTPQRKIARRSMILRTALERLLNNRQTIHARLDQRVLDSLLSYHLHENNIVLPYRFAVVNTLDTAVLMTNAPDLQKQAQQASLQNINEVSIRAVNNTQTRPHVFEQMPGAYSATLFPNDLIGTSYKLMLDFPNHSSSSLALMIGVGATSLLSIALVIGCFAWTLLALMRQKKISEVKNDFINNMTHELKTPIATISMASEALLDGQMRSDEKRVERFASIIHEENKRLSGHVEKVLKSAQMEKRVQAGSLDMTYTQVNVAYMLTDIIASFELQVAAKQGTVTCALEAHQDIIQADETHLANVISNLIDNAIKYSGDAAPQITIATQSVGDQLWISVADCGIGIKKEHIKHVFEKFYRVPTGNIHNVKGFGLGLNYVLTIVEAHGGTIHVQSEFGKGSVFTVKLPLRQGVHL